jgi:hypothetical protein
MVYRVSKKRKKTIEINVLLEFDCLSTPAAEPTRASKLDVSKFYA